GKNIKPSSAADASAQFTVAVFPRQNGSDTSLVIRSKLYVDQIRGDSDLAHVNRHPRQDFDFLQQADQISFDKSPYCFHNMLQLCLSFANTTSALAMLDFANCTAQGGEGLGQRARVKTR